MNEFEHKCSKLLSAIDDVVAHTEGMTWKDKLAKLHEMSENAVDSTTTSWEEFTAWFENDEP